MVCGGTIFRCHLRLTFKFFVRSGIGFFHWPLGSSAFWQLLLLAKLKSVGYSGYCCGYYQYFCSKRRM
jgi:hypothetical protein